MTTSHRRLALVLACLCLWMSHVPRAHAQIAETSDGGAAGVIQEAPLQATLLMVNENWTLGENADDIRAQVTEALKDKPIPESLRDDPAAAGARIWFLSDHATLYQPDELASLVTWFRKHQLLHGAHAGKRMEPLNTIPKPLAVGLEIAPEVIPLPTGMPEPVQSPLIQHRHDWSWSVLTVGFNTAEWLSLQVDVNIAHKSVYAGSDAQQSETDSIVSLDQLQVGQARFNMPNGWMAVVPWYLDDRERSAHIRNPPENIYPVVVIYQASEPYAWLEKADDALEPQLRLPARLAPLQSSGGPQFGGRMTSALGSGGMRSGGASRFGSRGAISNRGGTGQVRPDENNVRVESEQFTRSGITRTYKLTYVAAEDVFTRLDLVAEAIGVMISVDTPTNMFIARGTEDSLKTVENIIAKLDVPTAGERDRRGGSRSSPATIAKMRDIYERLDGQSRQLASRRDPQLGDQHTEVTELRQQIRKAVAQAFAVRQELHRAEIEAMRAELVELEQMVSAREELKEEIIDERVQELLKVE